MTDAQPALLTLEGVSKSFGPVTVIDDVTVQVRAGEVEVLLGENGAGKSTLIKMMSRHLPARRRPHPRRREARPAPRRQGRRAPRHRDHHQELNLVPQLSVAENITLGRTPKRLGMVDRRQIAPHRPGGAGPDRPGTSTSTKSVGELGIARQQLVEIAKAPLPGRPPADPRRAHPPRSPAARSTPCSAWSTS